MAVGIIKFDFVLQVILAGLMPNECTFSMIKEAGVARGAKTEDANLKKMEPTPVTADPEREKLTAIRQTLLVLHKALLDSERTAYEIVHGRIASPGAFLQMLISDNRFAWLQPVTKLLVQIDESLAAKKPPATEKDFEHLIEDTRALLSPSSESNGFWKHYAGVVERDPAVALHHCELERQLT